MTNKRMKIYGTFLALCVFYPWETTAAFVAQRQRPENVHFFRTLQVTSALPPPWSSWLPFQTKDESKNKNKNKPFATMEKESRKQSLETRLSDLQKPGGRLATSPRSAPDTIKTAEQRSSTPITVHGGCLKTWSFHSPHVERIQVVLKTEGRPLEANIELWQGPDNTPVKMRVFVEDGGLRPFSAVIETPRRAPNTVAIRNIAQMEFPLEAYVVAAAATTDYSNNNNGYSRSQSTDYGTRYNNNNNGYSRSQSRDNGSTRSYDTDTPTTTIIQGGALRTFAFDPSVESVQVLLKTDGRPLNSRVELLQGPTNKKQVIELYTEDGMDRPFFAVIETPGVGNVVRVVNTATVEFPLTAWVEPYLIGTSYMTNSDTEAVLGGDGIFSMNHQRPW